MKTLRIPLLAALVACGTTNEKPLSVGRSPTVTHPGRTDRTEPGDRVAAAVPTSDAVRTDSGLASKQLYAGNGIDRPTKYSTVRVHYTGWTNDGKVFDSSRERGKPTEFAVNQVIPGWTEGLQLMTLGEERRLWIPAELAYGKNPSRGQPAGDLTFDVELLAIVSTPNIPDVPADVAAAPADATKTPSGLAYKKLTPGTGARPKRTDTVVVEYTGWSTDGTMFDSTGNLRAGHVMFRVSNGLKGWVEGLQLMQVGETARFWIPPRLALGDDPPPPTPKGTLVFDMHLIGIADD